MWERNVNRDGGNFGEGLAARGTGSVEKGFYRQWGGIYGRDWSKAERNDTEPTEEEKSGAKRSRLKRNET